MNNKHYCIEVHHQTGIKTFNCTSFAEVAYEEGWMTETFASLDEMADAWGSAEDLPAEWAEAARTLEFPIVHVSDDSGNSEFFAGKGFDEEAEARSFLASDLNNLIVIDTADEAKRYATEYTGHEIAKVRAAASEIFKEISNLNDEE
ncbi:MAG: hypothetical protein PHI85_09220 [Victivallaceae bacterium]|nr:hypothetical protein [Victivallaceae bacterium]